MIFFYHFIVDIVALFHAHEGGAGPCGMCESRGQRPVLDVTL